MTELRSTIEQTLRESEVCAPVVDELMARVRSGGAALLVDSIDEVDRPDQKRKVRGMLLDLLGEVETLEVGRGRRRGFLRPAARGQGERGERRATLEESPSCPVRSSSV